MRRARTEQERKRTGVQERLRSYVTQEPSKQTESEESNELTERNREIESAAIEHALAYETECGRQPIDANEEDTNNEGFDIVSRSSSGTIERYIEVKGLAEAWGPRGVMVTPAQFQFAINHGEKAWLYIVETALDSKPVVHRIQNFAARVWRYGFDDGWVGVTEKPEGSDAELPESRVG